MLFEKGGKIVRLLMAMTGEEKPRALQWRLNLGTATWESRHVKDGQAALQTLTEARFDLLLLHPCLPHLDGYEVLGRLWKMQLACPPRVLMLSEPELCKRETLRADCVAPLLASTTHLCRLLELLAQRKTPLLACGTRGLRETLIGELLDTLGVNPAFKGRSYIAWLLDRIIPSPWLENELTSTLYPACASVYRTTPAAVERCVRHAVEELFTRGSMEGIERYFGTTVDPERGKPTNRAFLIGAAEQLRARMDAAV